MIIVWIESFNITQVLRWVANWGMIYFLVNVGVSKWVNVLLSALGEILSQFELGIVIVLYLVLGITMFLLPPVPGVPVYLIGGILVPVKFSSSIGGEGPDGA